MIQKTITCLLAILFLTACTAPSATQTLTAPSEQILPEVIVQQFLADYQEAPQQLGGYLGEALRKGTSVEEYSQLLPLDGMIEGLSPCNPFPAPASQRR